MLQKDMDSILFRKKDMKKANKVKEMPKKDNTTEAKGKSF